MNPDKNKLEPIFDQGELAAERLETQKDELRRQIEAMSTRAFDADEILEKGQLVRADGSPVPAHWATFRTDELVVLKGYTFRVGHIGESHLLLEPVGPVIVGDEAQ
jgi:hypothetical protein